ncbi:MAG TPA: alpha-2-macroglobulin family protein, partial [Candidatus Eisenbacteria bacterium]|nr:alpha-2-macroglobulin family protein [Candidatus Eisenbacteria bacterium]
TSDSSFVLPADAALGDWRVSGTVGRATSGATFAVQEYRKPEFKVDVTPDREVYVNGDEVRFVVASTYFFGSPVFGATVRYNLFESRLDGQASFGESEEEAESPRPGYGRVLTTGEARTDVDGRVAIEFTPPRVTYDRRVSLEVEVVDASNRAVSARGSAIVGRGLFTIQVRPSAALVLAGQAIGIEVRTADHLGKPVTAAIQVDLDQDAWSPLEHRYVRSTRPLASATVTTDATGKGSLSLLPSPARSGYIKILARADDVKGNRVTDESSVWVYDADVGQYAYRYPNLEAFLDRGHYAAGDTARILVNTDARNAQVLATVEGKEIEAVQVVTLAGSTGLVSVPVRAEYAPNVFVSVSVRRGAEVRSRTLELSVVGPKHDLAIHLETDRPEYRPGDEAHIRVETRDGAGRPAPAEVSVGVVDEAIYSLRADDTADPSDVFYGKRPNWVTTSVSFPLLYYAGVDKGREREVRKDFRDVALWAPVVRTDAQGRADVALRWPDNLTTWRITSRGMSDATLVGKAVAKTLVSKPIVARMALPRMFIAGDETALLSVVNNRSKTPVLGMKESIRAEGYAATTGETNRTKDLPANGESRSAWPIRIARDLEGDSAQARFTFRAVGKDDADALELSTPVLPRAVPLGSRGAGVLDRANAEVTVTLPSDLVTSGSWVSIECSPSPAAMTVTAANYLAFYPYSCTEQTANAILAGAALRTVGMRQGQDVPGWGDAGKKLAPFVDHLVALQSPDGGWGWWAGGERDPYLTALALEALARADAVGLATPAATNAMWRGARVVPQLLAEERSLDGQCYMLARLAPIYARGDADQQAPGFPEEMSNVAYSVYGGRDRLGTAALALATRAHAEMGRMTEANALVALVKKRGVSSAGETYWPGDSDSYDWFGEDVENTGYALAAILSVAPTDPLGPSTVRWLAGRRHGGYWRSTRATAPVVTALAQYLLGRATELKPQYRLRVQWNGDTVMDRAVTPADAYGGEGFYVRVPGSRLKKGENRLAISRDGSGAAYFAWEARAMVPSPGPSTAGEKRLVVTREFFRAERTADRRGRPRYLATPIAAGERVHIGEPVMVRLTLKADRDLRWIMIEDPRPSGFEVSELLPQGTEWPWGTHAEQRDDRNVFFLDQLEKGETVIEYIDRPEMGGSFTALPTTVSSMYMPELTSRSGEDRVIVRER